MIYINEKCSFTLVEIALKRRGDGDIPGPGKVRFTYKIEIYINEKCLFTPGWISARISLTLSMKGESRSETRATRCAERGRGGVAARRLHRC